MPKRSTAIANTRSRGATKRRNEQDSHSGRLPPASRRPCSWETAPSGYVTLQDPGVSSSVHSQEFSTSIHSNPQGGSGADEGDGAHHSDREGSIAQEVIMAIDMKESGAMSCAYFSTEQGILYLSEDVPMAVDDIAEQFIIHVQPTTVLVSPRAPERLLAFLEKRANSLLTVFTTSNFTLRYLQSSEFSIDLAHERLVNLPADAASAVFSTGFDGGGQVGDGAYHESQLFKAMRCGASINLHSHISVGCAGAIIGDLHRRKSVGFLPDGQAAEVIFHVQSLEIFSLSTYMFINADALQSLQIVQTELHPNSQTLGPDLNRQGIKESLSVYGLFHHLACTPQGRAQLRQIFLRPTLDLNVITERQRSISVVLQPDNAERLRQSTSILRRVQNLRKTMSQLRKGIDFPSSRQSFDWGVWGSIRNFTARSLELRETVSGLSGGERLGVVCKLLEGLQPGVLAWVGDMVNKTIDFEQSKSRHRASVKAGVDHQLDQLKRRYDGMDGFLTAVVNQMNQELPEWAGQYVRSCIFLPQLGFLTVVEPNQETGNGRYEGEGSNRGPWEKLFTVDGSVCYKNGYMRELDEEYGDMYCQIGDREVEVIHDLAKRVLEHEDMLVLASDICGEFDSISALALGAEKYGWKAPSVVEASVIEIEEGRHPLQELVVPAFVPNDSFLGNNHQANTDDVDEDLPRSLVLTGPNHSGKSVYLKQVAIIVYLAHIGSFVPATQAIIGLTDKILTRISTRESTSGNESAFGIDLQQVALSMRCSTPRSLICVDEFGKGTNADDGAGLLAAMLYHFLSLGRETPRLLVATHFHEVFEGDYLATLAGLRLVHMDVKVDFQAAEAEDQVTYLFKLANGHSSSSFGSRCADMNGVPSAVVKRAEAISGLLSRNENLGAICTRLSQKEEESLEQAELVARRFLGQDFNGGSRTKLSSNKSLLNGLLS